VGGGGGGRGRGGVGWVRKEEVMYLCGVFSIKHVFQSASIVSAKKN